MPYINSYIFAALPVGFFWVGSGGTWDNTNSADWAATPTGPGGYGVPTANDFVFFTSLSGDCTLASTAAGKTVDFNHPLLGPYAGTLTHPNTVTWTISGGLRMSPGMTYSPGISGSGGTVFNASDGPYTVNYAGHSTRTTTFQGTGSWILGDDLNTTSASLEVRIYQGTFDTDGYDMSVGGVDISGSSVRTISLGSSTIDTGGGSVVTSWDATTTTNLTFNAETSTIIIPASNSFLGGGLDYYNVIVSAAEVSRTFSGENTFNDLTITGGASSGFFFRLSNNQTVNGTLSITGNSTLNKVLVSSDTLGTARTITAATVVAENAILRDITGTSWDFSSQDDVGDAWGNTGITFPAAVNTYWVGNGGSWRSLTKWASSSGGTAGTGRYPLPQDTAIFDANSITSAGQTITIDGGHISNIDASAVLNDPLFDDFNAEVFYGSLINGSTSLTGDNIGSCDFYGRGTHTISLAGSWRNGCFIEISAFGGSYTFDSDFLNSSDGTTAVLTISSGTVDFNDNNIKFPRFSIGAAATVNFGTGTITASGTITPWTVNASATLNAETSTVDITNTGAVTFNGGGKTYYNVDIRSSANTATVNGSNTYNSLNTTGPAVIRFENNSTHTITSLNGFGMIGTLGNIVNLNRVSSGTWNIVSTQNQTIDYVTIANSTASGGGTFSATNSSDGGGNTNWTITA